MSERRVAVVGAGVIGLCAAYSLRKRGAEVVVLEAATAGSGASEGNAGWIVPSLSGPLPAPGLASLAVRSAMRPDSPVYVKPRLSLELASWAWRFLRRCNERDYLAGLHATARLNARTMELYDDLAADGVAFEAAPDGLLFACRNEDDARHLLEGLAPMAQHGYELPEKVLTWDDLHALEPALSAEVESGFLLSRERAVRPDTLMRGLASRVRAMGVEIREDAPVLGLTRGPRGGWVVQTPTGTVDADAVLLAAGAWTARLAGRLGVKMPVQAGKGYSFSISPQVMPQRSLYLVDAKIGCTPLGDRLRIAGTMELSGINTRLDRRRIDAMVHGARRYLAGWDHTPIADAWTGMRPVAPDGLPILGAIRGHDGLYVATGHSMLGITLGPATGEAMAALILEGRAAPDLAPFSLDRFRR